MKFVNAEHNLTPMENKLLKNLGIGLFIPLVLTLSACGQRVGMAPVIQGVSGETVRISPKVRAAKGKTITVRQGDALYKIARRYRVRLRSLIEVNSLKPPYTIYPGQKLRLPFYRVHTVRKGQTVYQIAEKYNTRPITLVRLNRIAPPYRLSPGQTIVLPGNQSHPRRRERASPNSVSEKSSDGTAFGSGATREIQGKSSLLAKQKRGGGSAILRPRTNLRAPSRSGFIWPVRGRVLSRFGTIGKGLQNDGINIQAKKGTPVRAIQNGIVAYAGNELRGFGNLLLLKHSGRWISAYAHNSELLVRTGQTVTRGQVISRVGRTGSVDKSQLHFELRRGNRAVNPERYLGRQTAAAQN